LNVLPSNQDLIQHIDFTDEDLGRRAVNDEDRSVHKKSMRFSFRKKLIPDNLNDTFEIETRDNPNIDFAFGNEVVSLLAAFRMLAATKSPDKEGDHLGSAARDDYIVAAMSSAKKVENRVVEILEEIGEIVVHAERTTSDIRGDSVFEYFCEKNILSLIVDITKTKERKPTDARLSDTSCYGVVWTPLVKAQCFQTTSFLLSNVQTTSVVYYLLSHNYINEQIMCMTPFQQWTHSSLTKMMPEYVDLLKNVTMQLTDDPLLFPFLIIDDPENRSTKFPLFSAALELATSAFAESDASVYDTCITIVVNLMKIKSESIEKWFMSASSEQKKLADHLSQRLLNR
jgi:protein CLEC16A